MASVRWVRWLLAALMAAWFAGTSFFTVEETQQALVLRFGRPLAGITGPGLHLKMPWPIDRIIRLDRRLLVFDNEPTEMLTRDKKNVLVDSFLCWRIVEPLRFVQTVKTREEAEARLLDLTVSELGAAVGSEPMDAFLNADPVKLRLRQVVEQAAANVREAARASYGIDLVDLEINGFSLPRQNRASVIERMRAERARIATAYRSEGDERALKIEAEASSERERILAEARGQAEATRGAGEAEALRRMAAAYAKDPELYRFLAGLESSERILDENTTIFLEAGSPLVPLIDAP